MRGPMNIAGRRFGRLLAVKLVGKERGHYMWLCKCDCGNTKKMKVRSLMHDNIKSCGCLLKWRAPGYVKRKFYHTWIGIIYRCYKTTEPSYKRYGAKGIKVCDEWRNDYWAFHKWMELSGWKPGLTVDRFPNKNGNYSPENCRLADSSMQNNNRNDNAPLEYNGEVKNVSEWAHIYRIAPTTLFSRLNDGWDAHSALTTPVGKRQGYKKRSRNHKGQFI
jgi:hypothetical protein